MDASRFMDEFRPFRRGELALARGLIRDALNLSPEDVHVLRYGLRLAQLSATEGERDALVEPLTGFRLKLVQTLAPIMPTGPAEMNESTLRAAIGQVAGLVDEARRRACHAEDCSPEQLDAQVSHKHLVLVLGGAGGCGHVYLGVLQRLAELSLEPSFMLGCSIGAILAVLRARSRHFDLEELLEEVRLLRTVAALGAPGRSRFGLPGPVRIDLPRALGPLFTRDDGEPVSLGELALPVEALATGIRVGAPLPGGPAGTPLARGLKDAEALSNLSGPAVARTVSALISLAMSRRLLLPILLGAEEGTASLPALDAVGFSSAIPVLLSYDLAPEDLRSRATLEQVFARHDLTGLCDGLLTSAVPARFAWERVEGGKIRSRNCAILALHALEASQKGPAGALLAPFKRAFAGTAHRDRPFWDLCVRFPKAPGVFDLLPRPEALRQAVASGREAFADTEEVLTELLEPVPPWREIVARRGGVSVAGRSTP